MRRIVVVGGGVAGLTAAESLRERGFDGELTLIGDEPHEAYSRPALSKAALRDDDPARLRLPTSTHGAVVLQGVTATGVDPSLRRVTLDGGDTIPYDGLMLAGGSRARRLTGHGGEFTLRDLDDMIRLRTRLADRPSVVVVGGGALGMEVASGAVEAGCTTTLVTNRPPLRRHVGRFISEVLTAAAEERGLRIVRSVSITVDVIGDHPRAVLEDGTVLEADVLVSAVGDVPNVEWLAASGLASPSGVEVDPCGRVLQGGIARPDVVAAGDLAIVPTAVGRRRLPLWTSAIDQAKVAAPALVLGEEAPPLTLRPYFWTEQFGVTVRMSGETPGDADPHLEKGDPASRSAVWTWPGDPVTGGTAAAVNFPLAIPRLRRLAYSQTAA